MGSLGVPEMMVIFLLALVLFGPKKLPEIGRTIGKAITEFLRASTELKDTFNKEIQTLERETDSIKQEVTNEYQQDTYNYDYSSYETPSDGTYSSESDSAAIPSSESASATQGAELPPVPEGVPAPEGSVARGSEPEAQAAVEQGADSGHAAPAAEPESTATPAEHKA
jgi:TatA/E family protein of Tat protein translocase